MVRTGDVWSLEVPGVGAGDRYGFRAHGLWDPLDRVPVQPVEAAASIPTPMPSTARSSWTTPCSATSTASTNLGRQGIGINTDDSAPFVPHGVVVDRQPPPPDGGRRRRVRRRQLARHRDLRAAREGLQPAEPGRCRRSCAEPTRDSRTRPRSKYLRDLGVTAVELLPVHQIATEAVVLKRGLVNYWGYNPLAFGSGAQRLRKYTGSACHRHRVRRDGARPARGRHRGAARRGLQPHGRRRRRRPHALAAGPGQSPATTGCAPTTAAATSTAPVWATRCGSAIAVVDQLVIDTLRWWVEECGVDGFRFDLASSLGRNTDRPDVVNLRYGLLVRISEDPVLSKVKLIAEPWDLGPNGYQLGEFPPGWTEWNDKYRDTVRDFWRSASAGRARHRDPHLRLVGHVRRRRPPPHGVDQLRHRARRLHPPRPGDATAVKHNDANLEARCRRQQRQPVATTTVSRARPPTSAC